MELFLFIFPLIIGIGGAILINKSTEAGGFDGIKSHLRISWMIYLSLITALILCQPVVWRFAMNMSTRWNTWWFYLLSFIFGGFIFFGYAWFANKTAKSAQKEPIKISIPKKKQINNKQKQDVKKYSPISRLSREQGILSVMGRFRDNLMSRTSSSAEIFQTNYGDLGNEYWQGWFDIPIMDVDRFVDLLAIHKVNEYADTKKRMPSFVGYRDAIPNSTLEEEKEYGEVFEEAVLMSELEVRQKIEEATINNLEAYIPKDPSSALKKERAIKNADQYLKSITKPNMAQASLTKVLSGPYYDINIDKQKVRLALRNAAQGGASFFRGDYSLLGNMSDRELSQGWKAEKDPYRIRKLTEVKLNPRGAIEWFVATSTYTDLLPESLYDWWNSQQKSV